MEGYGSAIYWLETAPAPVRPALTEDVEVDVAIVGGGFLGLWTAYEIVQASPSSKVVVLEGEEVAHGASGRAGGFAMTLLDMSLSHLLRNYGPDAAKDAHEAVAAAVHEIGDICKKEGIDCDYHLGGLLVVATNPGQENRVRSDLRAAQQLGLERIRELSGKEVREEVDSPTYRMALFEEDCAVLHPAKLTRGLASVVESRGVSIFEGSPVEAIDNEGKNKKVRLRTPSAKVVAESVVLCTNAWAYRLPRFKRKIIPLYTYILLTEPLDDRHLDRIGWRKKQGIEDKRNYVHYYRMTADNRILWGGTDGVVYRDLGIHPRYDRNDEIFSKLEKTFRRTFPQLDDVRFTHRWGGPVAMTPTFVPIYGSFPDSPVYYGLGCNGHGIAPARLGGKILADLVLGRDRGLTNLFFVNGTEIEFPPNPLAWLGAELTRRALLRQDYEMDKGRPGGEMDPLLLKLIKKFS